MTEHEPSDTTGRTDPEPLAAPVDVALEIALEHASDERVIEHIRRALQARVIVDEDVDVQDGELVPDGGALACDQCDGEIEPEHHRVYQQPGGDHLDLCLECQTTVRRDRLYRPATDGGTRTAGQDERDLVGELEDGAAGDAGDVVVDAVCTGCQQVRVKRALDADPVDPTSFKHVCHRCQRVTWWNPLRVLDGGDQP